MRPGHVPQRQRIGSHVNPDAFHGADGTAGQHLRSVDRRRPQRLVVCLKRPYPVLHQHVFDVPQDVKKAGHRRTGIAGHQMNAPIGFEGAFNQQFIASENLVAGIGQKTRVGRHNSLFLPRAASKLMPRRGLRQPPSRPTQGTPISRSKVTLGPTGNSWPA
jgi:hypothetical protein